MRLLILALVLAAAPATADIKRPGGAVEDCYCRDGRGGQVRLGETTCLFVGGRAFLAQCQMALNNPVWRDLGTGCVTSSVTPAAGGATALRASPPDAPG